MRNEQSESARRSANEAAPEKKQRATATDAQEQHTHIYTLSHSFANTHIQHNRFLSLSIFQLFLRCFTLLLGALLKTQLPLRILSSFIDERAKGSDFFSLRFLFRSKNTQTNGFKKGGKN